MRDKTSNLGRLLNKVTEKICTVNRRHSEAGMNPNVVRRKFTKVSPVDAILYLWILYCITALREEGYSD
jgi:hypothetical protein